MYKDVNLTRIDAELIVRFIEQSLESCKKKDEYLMEVGLISKTEFYALKLDRSHIERIIWRLR